MCMTSDARAPYAVFSIPLHFMAASDLPQVFVVTGPLYLPRLTRNGYSMGYSLIGEVLRRPAV